MYKYIAKHNDVDLGEFCPLLDSDKSIPNFKFEQFEKECFSILKMLDKFCIVRSDNTEFYDLICSHISDDCDCEEYCIDILMCCKNEYKKFLTIYFSNRDINLVKGTNYLKVREFKSKSPYDKLINNWKNKVNFFDSGIRRKIKVYCGEIELINCLMPDTVTVGLPYTTYIDNCIPQNAGFTVVEHNIFSRARNIDTPTVITTFGNTIWGRECKTQSIKPNGNGWIQDGSKWCRPLQTTLVNSDNSIYSDIDFAESLIQNFSYPLQNENIDSAISFSDVILNAFPCKDQPFKSNFLQINADGTNPQNKAYDYSDLHYKGLYFIQTRDVFLLGSNQGLFFEISFKQLYEALQCIFEDQLCLWFDGQCWRLEHCSYKISNGYFDLKNSKEPLDTDFLESSYIDESISKKIFDNLGYRKSHNFQIEYDGCVPAKSIEKTYNCNFILTDFLEIVRIKYTYNDETNEIETGYEYEDNDSVNNSLTLLETYEDSNGDLFISDDNTLIAGNGINYCLSPAAIIENITCLKQPYCKGTAKCIIQDNSEFSELPINQIDVDLEFDIEKIKTIPIDYEFSCEDILLIIQSQKSNFLIDCGFGEVNGDIDINGTCLKMKLKI